MNINNTRAVGNDNNSNSTYVHTEGPAHRPPPKRISVVRASGIHRTN